jgi:hypothetical protein
VSDVARDLRAVVDEALPRLQGLSETEAEAQRGTGKWSRKEILGHLIDSAANNHQRFVRGQIAERLVLPGYEQDTWVRLQGYRRRSWAELLLLWEAYNRHLAHVIELAPAARLDTPCAIGDNDPVTLGWIMSDYVRHQRHHLAQILG